MNKSASLTPVQGPSTVVCMRNQESKKYKSLSLQAISHMSWVNNLPQSGQDHTKQRATSRNKKLT